jgi:hypothetical protein
MPQWSARLLILVLWAGIPSYAAGTPLQTSGSAATSDSLASAATSDSLATPDDTAPADTVAAIPSVPPRHCFVVEGTVNSDDKGIGVTYRFYVLPETRVAIFGSVSGRFWDEVVRVPYSEGVQLQVRETRELYALGGHYAPFLNGWLGAFLDAGAGYTTARYDGVSLEPEEGWTPLLRVGATLRFSAGSNNLVLFEVGYRYADLRSVPTNWLHVAVGGSF